MAKIVKSQKFVFTSAEANNNKVWQYDVYDDGTTHIQWGRIGSSLQEQRVVITDSKLQTKINEKTGKGYREVTIMAAPTSPSGPSGDKTHVQSAALRDIANDDPVLTPLIKRLAEANKHEIQIASGGQMDVDLSTGIISTPVGVVSKSNVLQARTILTGDLGSIIKDYIKTNDEKVLETPKFKETLSEYLMLVPQRVGHRNWHRSFLTDDAGLLRQASLMDQLEASIELVEQRMTAAQTAHAASTGQPINQRAFDVKLELMKDTDADWKQICKMYREGKNDRHSSHHLSPKRGFRMVIPHMRDAFQADGSKLTRTMSLWHGSRVFNLLSIMKRGFVLPKQLNTAVIAGAMFGSGLYFSDQSTKSLNYSYGYWQGGGGVDNNCFMFVVDVAVGKQFTPKGPQNFQNPPAGYDSIFAEGNKSGVLNNEMIVFRTGQANITHLIEFA